MITWSREPLKSQINEVLSKLSSIPWPGMVVGSLCSIVADKFPLQLDWEAGKIFMRSVSFPSWPCRAYPFLQPTSPTLIHTLVILIPSGELSTLAVDSSLGIPPPLPLTSVHEYFHPGPWLHSRNPSTQRCCHHRTGYIHNYGTKSIPLC